MRTGLCQFGIQIVTKLVLALIPLEHFSFWLGGRAMNEDYSFLLQDHLAASQLESIRVGPVAQPPRAIRPGQHERKVYRHWTHLKAAGPFQMNSPAMGTIPTQKAMCSVVVQYQYVNH